MEETDDFHFLIEIVVRYDDAKRQLDQLRSRKTLKNFTFWENKMRAWIEENYKDPGIGKIRY